MLYILNVFLNFTLAKIIYPNDGTYLTHCAYLVYAVGIHVQRYGYRKVDRDIKKMILILYILVHLQNLSIVSLPQKII
jgi:hypothetical protein